MRCPVCGSNMKSGRCRYCNVTDVQVNSSSNKQAKIAMKNHENNKVLYSTTKPNDVNKTTLVLLTVFLGLFGVGNFYIGKKIKGIVGAVGMGLCFIFAILSVSAREFGWNIYEGMSTLLTLFSLIGAVSAGIWIVDIAGLLFKTYKYPVVMEGYVPTLED